MAIAKAGSDGLIAIAGHGHILRHETKLHRTRTTYCGVRHGHRRRIGHLPRRQKLPRGCLHEFADCHFTVEGANIMTRSFQIIGQGLTRCHPHMSELLKAMQLPPSKEKQAVQTFVKQFHKIIGHGVSNFFGSVSKGIGATFSSTFRSKKAYKNGDDLLVFHEKQLLRLSNNFALTADLCFTLGGRLKFEELLMGRLADALGAIYLGHATLHHYHRRRGIEGLEELTEHAMLRLEREAQDALYVASENFPGPLGPVASTVMKMGCFPH